MNKAKLIKILDEYNKYNLENARNEDKKELSDFYLGKSQMAYEIKALIEVQNE